MNKPPKLTPNEPCPCHSGLKYERCCRPFHQGAAAPTPEALMRSRYAAFASGRASYVMDTTHPEGTAYESDREAWERSIAQFSSSTDFVGLKILVADLEGGSPEGPSEGAQPEGIQPEEIQSGEVTFRATLRQGDRDVSFTEHSRFLKVQGRWLYHSGDLS